MPSPAQQWSLQKHPLGVEACESQSCWNTGRWLADCEWMRSVDEIWLVLAWRVASHTPTVAAVVAPVLPTRSIELLTWHALLRRAVDMWRIHYAEKADTPRGRPSALHLPNCWHQHAHSHPGCPQSAQAGRDLKHLTLSGCPRRLLKGGAGCAVHWPYHLHSDHGYCDGSRACCQGGSRGGSRDGCRAGSGCGYLLSIRGDLTLIRGDFHRLGH